MRAFREAVEANDLDAVEALLTEDVVFTSPAVFKPYTGRPITAAILRAVAEVFEDFRYVREINDVEGRDHALVFTARVGDRQIEGCDFIHVGDDGRIEELTVMVRPLSGAQALAGAMGARFEQIAREAGERTA
ncbi:nuclear transport factor 2 family protein [Streptomyces sp. NPDC005931]|uniref:nuclear transport factor 2 family protein n=1 Tax=Streptomyces sp. NPDC005931 TaxID=3364737 RepID=UPI0036B07321